MARVNICGFETGDVSESASSSGTVSVVTSPVRSGTYAMRANPVTTAVGYARFIGTFTDGTATTIALATCFMRFYFRYATKPASASEEICEIQDSANTSKFQIRIGSGGVLSAWNATTQLGSDGTTVLSADTWHCIEVKLGTGASAAWELRINGVSEISGTLNNSVNNGVYAVGKSTNRNGQTVDFFYDDLSIDDADYPGPGAILRLDPAADVAKTNWVDQAASSTNEFQSVDDYTSQAGHDTDTTYVVTSTAGTVTFTVSFTALPAGVMTINEIKLITFCRDVSTVNAYQIQLKPTSNAITTTAIDGGNTYFLRAILYKASGGTDVLSPTNVNTAQASIIKTQAQARELRCTSMAVMVDVVPAPHSQGTIIG